MPFNKGWWEGFWTLQTGPLVLSYNSKCEKLVTTFLLPRRSGNLYTVSIRQSIEDTEEEIVQRYFWSFFVSADLCSILIFVYQECGGCWQSVHDGQEPASQAGHQGRPDWTLPLNINNTQWSYFFVRSLLGLKSKIILNAKWTGHLVCVAFWKIQLGQDVWTQSYIMMVLLRTSNC